jgi:hypothetical protein
MSMRFDDPDQAVSIAAILFFIRAAFDGVEQLGVLFRGGVAILPLLLIVGSVAAGAGLLKGLRWAWPLGVAMAVLSGLFNLLALPLGLLSLVFDVFIVYLLFRPAVRERFGQFTQR